MRNHLLGFDAFEAWQAWQDPTSADSQSAISTDRSEKKHRDPSCSAGMGCQLGSQLTALQEKCLSCDASSTCEGSGDDGLSALALQQERASDATSEHGATDSELHV